MRLCPGDTPGSRCHRKRTKSLRIQLGTIEVQAIFAFLAYVGILAQSAVGEAWVAIASRGQVVRALAFPAH